jgi:hypothetical protein
LRVVVLRRRRRRWLIRVTLGHVVTQCHGVRSSSEDARWASTCSLEQIRTLVNA